MMLSHVVNDKHIGYDDLYHQIRGGNLAKNPEWEERVKGLLKAELKRRNLGYRELADRLGALGIHDTERNIANKISRGGFTAVFLVQCLVAIGAQELSLRHD